jgi:phosphatidylserine/phosphatidylglycerophosphate/cardiolipin synthase-like enzyme
VASGSLVSSSGAEVFILPDSRVKNHLLNAFITAKERIWIEIYTWTDKDILQAIVDAKKRSLDVRVVLEGNVYGTPRVNAPVFALLKKEGIPVVYADNSRFTFTHAKFFLVDNTYYISTGNLTRSFFLTNREFLFSDSLSDNLVFLENLFLADFAHREISPDVSLPDTLVLSPINSRSQLEFFLS